MKNYTLFRFGKCYINRAGDFVIGLLYGDKKHGYVFAGSYAKPNVILGTFQLMSRIIPNDGNWIEVDHAMFNVASAFHVSGHVVTFPTDKRTGREIPTVTKKY